ncbi:MAG: hypothetical protein WA799_04900, partial [Nitrosotalea sp.]
MKTLSLFLLILVGAMIFGIPSQSYADPQFDTLLNIATQARDNLSITISQISNVPDEINQLYNQGSNETDALAEAINQNDTNSAKQHFLTAMKFFQETNDQINSLNATSSSNDQQKTEMIIQLRGEIARLENMGSLLKSIASENNIDINFTNFDEMIQSTNQDLDSGNSTDASKQLQNANDFVVATHNSLTNIAQERISEREKNFAENQIVQLNNTSQLNATQNVIPVNSSHATPITNNSNIIAPITNNSNITTKSNPRDMVAELKQLVSEGKVDQAINLIKIIQAYQKAQLTEKSAEMSSPANFTVPITPQPTLSTNPIVPNTPPSTPTSPTSPTNSTVPNTPPSTPTSPTS